MLPIDALEPGVVAQLVEQGSHNPCVGSSILPAASEDRALPTDRGRGAAGSFERAVLSAVREGGLLARGEHAVVAVSGGTDSTALLLVLDALSRRWGQDYVLGVAHLDHGLRGAESEADADFVAALARAHGIPCIVGRAGPVPKGENLEAWARAERAAFLTRAARELGARTICLGHTRNDQAETVLMRLARGAGPGSLGAMRARRADGVVRPLLERTRAECAAYVEHAGWRPRHDRSNDDDRFFRNRVRRDVLPELSRRLGVDLVARLARLADDLAVESQLADERIAELLAEEKGEGLSVARVRGAGAAAGRLVHAWLVEKGVRASHAQIDDIVRIARGDRPSARVDVAGGLAVQRSYEGLALATARRFDRPAEAVWPIPGRAVLGEWELRAAIEPIRPGESADAAATLRVDRASLGAFLAVRAPRPGDRIRLRGGSRKLADVMIDRRVPKELRPRVAVVTIADGSIFWVPGVAVSSAALVPSHSDTIVALTVEKGFAGSDTPW